MCDPSHEQRLLDEYASAGNDDLLLARLEREHYEMRKEMGVTTYLALTHIMHESKLVVKPVILSHMISSVLAPASETNPEKNHSKAVQAISLV